MDWLKMIAPTLATAIGGPFGTMAYGLAAKVMNISPEEAQRTIESGKLTAEQIASVQLAEIEIKAKAQELGLDFAKVAADDRKSARDMQTTTRSMLPPVLAILVTLGFFGILVGMMTKTFATSDALLLMLGSLGTAWTGIIAFYFGSSAGSQAKNDLLGKTSALK
jgi:xanthosine utilization system XapX-like protein